MRRLGYLLREALTNVRLNRTTTLIAVATTAFTLACFGVFLLLYLNLKGLVRSLQEDIRVIVYLREGLAPQAVADLQRRLKSQPEVVTLIYVSKEQALADFTREFPGDAPLLQGLGENPLPASLEVTLAPAFRSPAAVRRWAERVQALPEVEQVQYSREWIENLTTIIGYLELAAMGVGALLTAASVTIIASIIRLTLYARRDEIEILGLIGATGAFIKIPYLLEGAFLGTAGGLLSVLLLRGAFEYVTGQLGLSGQFLGITSALGFFPLHVSAVLVTAGLLVGFAGSFVSLLQFGRARP
ncbi:cell division protein FtsX [Nitrospira sp. Kam-Ns4a]